MSLRQPDPSLRVDFPFFSRPTPTNLLLDRSGNNNHGTPTGFVNDDSEFIDSRLGQAIIFDGTKHIVITETGGSIVRITDFSYEIWIRLTNPAGVCTVLSKGVGFAIGYDLLYRADLGGTLQVRLFNVGTVAFFSTFPIIDRNLHQIFITANRSGLMRLHIDGEFNNSGDISALQGDLANVNPLILGRQSVAGGVPLQGTINRYRLWLEEKGIAEIRHRFKNPRRV